MSSDDDFLSEIQDEFLDETVGFLEQTENQFLQLETTPNDESILESILRLAHNIKGSAAAVGFDGLSKFAHNFENLLVKIKQGEIEPTQSVIDVLLQSNDMLKSYVDSLRDDKSASVDTTDITNQIISIMEGSSVEENLAQMDSLEQRSTLPELSIEPGPEVEPLVEPLVSAEEVSTLPELDIPSADEIIEKPVIQEQGALYNYEKVESIVDSYLLGASASLEGADNEEVEEEILTELTSELDEKEEVVEKVAEVTPITEAIKEAPVEKIVETPKPAAPVAPVTPIASAAPTTVRDVPQAKVIPIKKEDPSKEAVSAKRTDEFIRLPLRKIEDLLNDLSEQVILQSSLDHYRENIVSNAEEVNKTILQLGKITTELQQTAISLRMFSLKSVFSKMQRTVRDTAKILNKDIHFITEGEDTELDKTIIDELSSPLTHVIRNSVDHGIETPDEREAAGKPRRGTIKMSASYSGRYFYLTVEDDGKGLDKERIRAKAIEKGIISADAEMTDQEIHNLIFLNSFSTKDEATDISGRGVGMDAIKGAIEKLRGSIDVQSTAGQGSKITIKLPPTLAIFNGIVVRAADRKFIFPSSEVQEIYHINPEDMRDLSPGKKIIRIRDDVYNIINLKTEFNLPKDTNHSTNNVIMTINQNGQNYGILIDDVLLQQRIVFKNLGKELEGLPGIAGGTILADGKVALIVELGDIVDQYEGN